MNLERGNIISSIMNGSAVSPGSAAQEAEDGKLRKYAAL